MAASSGGGRQLWRQAVVAVGNVAGKQWWRQADVAREAAASSGGIEQWIEQWWRHQQWWRQAVVVVGRDGSK